MAHLLFYCFLSLGLGIFFDQWLDLNSWVYVFPAAFLLCIIHLKSFNKIFTLSCLALSAFLLGAFLQSTSLNEMRQSAWMNLVEEHQGQEVMIKGKVTDHLRRYSGFDHETQYSFVMSSLGWVRQGKEVNIPGKVRVRGVVSTNEIQYGDNLIIRGSMELPPGRRNPAAFNYRRYLKTRDTYAFLNAESFELAPVDSGPSDFVYKVKNHLRSVFSELFNAFEFGVLSAIFLGERQDLDRSLRESLSNTGTMHLFAISGLHVGLIAAILYGLLALFIRSIGIRSIVIMTLLIFYCVLVGSNPPVARATIMVCTALGAKVFFRRLVVLNALGLAGVIILMLNPDELFNPGFQLSFAAVFGLSIFTKRYFSIQDIRDSKADEWHVRLRCALRSLWVVSVVAWIVTAPVMIHYFHRFSILAPIANFFLIPVMSILVLLCILFSFASFLPASALIILKVPLSILIQALTLVVSYADQWHQATWTLPSWSIGTWLVLVLGLVAFTYSKLLQGRNIRLLASILLLINCMLGDQAIAGARSQPLTMTFFDVGQGDSIFFEFPKGGNLLVDTGKGPKGGWAIESYLKSRGIETIDAIVITHAHFDHSGSLEELVKKFHVQKLMDNGVGNDVRFYKQAQQAAHEQQVQRERIGRGDEIVGYSQIQLSVLHPDSSRLGVDSLNDESVVLLLRYRDTQVLLTGDLGERGVELMRLNNQVPRIHVLKMMHHGAQIHEQGTQLLEDAQPEMTIISVGLGNRYNHPHPRTIEALEAYSGQIWRTDEHGAVQIEMDLDGKLRLKTWAERRGIP